VPALFTWHTGAFLNRAPTVREVACDWDGIPQPATPRSRMGLGSSSPRPLLILIPDQEKEKREIKIKSKIKIKIYHEQC